MEDNNMKDNKFTSSDSIEFDSAEALLTEIHRLQAENATLTSQTTILAAKNLQLTTRLAQYEGKPAEKGPQPLFPQFAKLPPELRLRIWRFALTQPQIHVFSAKRVSRSRVNILMNTCKDAKTEGMKLKLSYYKLKEPWRSELRQIRNYVNVEVDTLWFTTKPSKDYVADFFCGKCGEQFCRDIDSLQNQQWFCSLKCSPDRFYALALNHGDWRRDGGLSSSTRSSIYGNVSAVYGESSHKSHFFHVILI